METAAHICTDAYVEGCLLKLLPLVTCAKRGYRYYPPTLRQVRHSFSAACATARLYRSRDPSISVPHQLVERFYEQMKGEWEKRFQRACGFWRELIDDSVNRYLDCDLILQRLGGWFSLPLRVVP